MRIGINEVIIRERSDGNRQRDLNTLPTLLTKLCSRGDEALIYVSQNLSDNMTKRLVGNPDRVSVIKTPLSATSAFKRTIIGEYYWSRQVGREKLDLFHTSYYPVPRLKVPIVLTVNDVRFLHLPETYTRSRLMFLRQFVPYSLRRATRIITISGNTKDDLVRYFGISEGKVDVVYIPVDHGFGQVRDLKKLESVREKYGLPERYILYVGHLEPRKNLRRLIQAFSQLQIHVSYHLVILGKASFGFEEIFRQANQSDCASKVVFTGYVEDSDMAAVYTLADLLVFPSLHEGFGIPVLEAMACGTPVVTSNVSALPEIAGDAAVLVDPYDVSAIAMGISNVLSNSQVYQELVEKGLHRVTHFDTEQSASAILDSYEKAVQTL